MTDGPRSGRQRRRLTATVTDIEVVKQKAFLIGLARKASDIAEAEVSLHELALLTETAGSDPVGAELVRRGRPDPATFIGSGKADELAAETESLDVDVVVFDNDLSPAQQRNLQKIFECDVVDRVALILDIFAQHATSREGMLQVELAQHRYRLPRLRGRGVELSRLGGGIGTRGPGETQLETDRRRILGRISKLEDQLKDLSRSRDTKSKARRRAKIPLVSMVGYTNAGKSTLFNALTEADVLVEDQLFATLDSTVRKLELPGGRDVLASDTVGFVRRLPHQLVEAFRSTLEEVNEADLLIHVVDAADEDPDRQIAAVREVLNDIGAGGIPELVVINKCDIADETAVRRLTRLHGNAAAVSALTGAGLDDLQDAIVAALAAQTVEVELVVPFARGDVLAAAHRAGEVIDQDHAEGGTRVKVRLQPEDVPRFGEWTQPALGRLAGDGTPAQPGEAAPSDTTPGGRRPASPDADGGGHEVRPDSGDLAS
jgi:GTP-binding protein HflX